MAASSHVQHLHTEHANGRFEPYAALAAEHANGHFAQPTNQSLIMKSRAQMTQCIEVRRAYHVLSICHIISK
jgi:hypothetical protein